MILANQPSLCYSDRTQVFFFGVSERQGGTPRSTYKISATAGETAWPCETTPTPMLPLSVDLIGAPLSRCALIHHHRPDLLDWDLLPKNEPHKCAQIAFDIAARELNVPVSAPVPPYTVTALSVVPATS